MTGFKSFCSIVLHHTILKDETEDEDHIGTGNLLVISSTLKG